MSTFISEPGTRLGGRYRLEDRTATASGWAAWKAIDEILARPVTVVTFASGFPRIREVLTAARAAGRLSDARLAQVFDVEDDWDHAYVVMEWAAGDTLDDLLAAGPLEPARGASIVAEAATALSAAHAAGLAHLCLTPESVRLTHGGGVKVVGLGIDAALAGATSDDPALTDTTGLGRLLYSALTGHWPGPDYPELPPAPMVGGNPRRPRQVRAGVPRTLDDITCRALQLGGRDAGDATLRRPDELASALRAVIPPIPPPPAVPAARAEVARRPQQLDRRERDYRSYDYLEHDYGPDGQRPVPPTVPADRRGKRSRLRIGVIIMLILVVMAGVVAATSPWWHRAAVPKSSPASHPPAKPSATAQVLRPTGASGYDPLTSQANDPNNENSQYAKLAIDGNPATAWTSQYYDSPFFGNLKSGSGLIVDMGRPIRLSSVLVTFGPTPGADVQIKIGNSDVRSAAALQTFTTVARASNVAGTHTFSTHATTTGRYVLIWFTKLPPDPKLAGKYMAQVSNVVVRGSPG
jgi:serine/threonine protein kinase